MERKQFKTTINAPKEKVWKALWDDATYREWTSPFSEGSHAETDWKKGSKVLFLDNKNSGMVSRIADLKENEFMSFEHLGEVRDGVEIVDKARHDWSGAQENYRLKAHDGKTDLTVDMDISADFADYFAKTWPIALDKIKEVSERDQQPTSR
jgi:hypothetical protein